MESRTNIKLNFTDQVFYCPKNLVNTYKNFEPLTTSLIQANADNKKCFIDIKANIGYFSVLAANALQNNSHIYSFEPMQDAYNILKKNTEKYNNCKSINLALGEKSEKVKFYSTIDYVNSGTTPSPFISNDLITQALVQQESLDLYAEKNGIPSFDLLKCDIQGDDICAIKGAKRLIENSPEAIIIVEWAPAWMKKAGFEAEDLIDILIDYDFKEITAVDDYTQKFYSVETMLDHFKSDKTGKRFCNLIASKKANHIRYT